MKWHITKTDNTRPDNMATCVCIHLYVFRAFFSKEEDSFITLDDYGNRYSFSEIKAWVPEIDLIQDLKER